MSDRATASLIRFECPECCGVLFGLDRPPEELEHKNIKQRNCAYCDAKMTRTVRPLMPDQFRQLQDLLRVD